MIRALIVDDEPLARRRLRALLAGERDFEVLGEAGPSSNYDPVSCFSTCRCRR